MYHGWLIMMKKLWLTADELAKRLKAGTAGGIVELAANEFLTPNAIDLADLRHVAVRRTDGSSMPRAGRLEQGSSDAGDWRSSSAKRQSRAANAGQGAANVCKGEADARKSEANASKGTHAVGVVLDRPTPLVRSLIDQLYRAGLPLADYTIDNCWIRNTQALCKAVASGELAGGVVFRPHAAEAVMLANKVRGARAVQGTAQAAVAAAIRHFAANMLVIEHAAATLFEMRSLVLAFTGGRAELLARNPLLEAVAELERS